MFEDDDDFIYGTSTGANSIESVGVTTADADTTSVNGLHAEVDVEVALAEVDVEVALAEAEAEAGVEVEAEADDAEEQEEQEQDEEQEDDEDSDIEIILDPEERHKAMSRDFRPQGNRQGYDGHRAVSSGTPPPGSRGPHLTTEYTPTPRGEAIPQKNIVPPPTAASVPPHAIPKTTIPPQTETRGTTPGQDTSSLPVVIAPPSHPPINPTEPGIIDGRSVLEVDLDTLSDKPWRRPGSDISDYFNYGFDEVSWEAYCYRRRDMTEMANHLKGVVTNFAGLPEDQISSLPPEVRAMVMAGATTLMSGGAIPHAGPQMMGVGVPAPGGMMNPHELGIMGVMSGGDMQPIQTNMMTGPVTDGDVMNLSSMAQEAFQQNNPLAGASGQMIPMAQDFGIQDPTAMGMFSQGMEGHMSGTGNGPSSQSSPVQGSGGASLSTPIGPAGARPGPTPPMSSFRGRGGALTSSVPLRGRGTFSRGRGRGGMFVGETGQPQIPIRPASPLPPGVPTGPRNQNRYKDRDGNAPAIEGLDYGGGMQGSADMDVRKRRISPPLDDGRSLKRR